MRCKLQAETPSAYTYSFSWVELSRLLGEKIPVAIVGLEPRTSRPPVQRFDHLATKQPQVLYKYPLIYISIYWMLAVDLTGEEASVAYIQNVSCKLRYINWNEPQATTYITQATFEWGLSMSGGYKQSLPGYSQGQSRTCYQEWDCHLNSKLIFTEGLQ